MARFQKRMDIWPLSPEQRKVLQPGQHVTAGGNSRGVWLGQKESGTDVVMWEDSASGRNREKYLRSLRDYAKA